MFSGPEMARMLKEFEDEYFTGDDMENPKNFQHHEQGLSSQKSFQKQVNALSATIRQMGNPFLDEFDDLVTLDSRKCTDTAVVTTVRTLEETGRKQYQKFVKTVLDERTHSIHDPIKRNSLALFRKSHGKKVQKKD